MTGGETVVLVVGGGTFAGTGALVGAAVVLVAFASALSWARAQASGGLTDFGTQVAESIVVVVDRTAVDPLQAASKIAARAVPTTKANWSDLAPRSVTRRRKRLWDLPQIGSWSKVEACKSAFFYIGRRLSKRGTDHSTFRDRGEPIHRHQLYRTITRSPPVPSLATYPAPSDVVRGARAVWPKAAWSCSPLSSTRGSPSIPSPRRRPVLRSR